MKAKIEPCIKVKDNVFFVDSVVTVTYRDRNYTSESSGRISEINEDEERIELDMSSNFKSDTIRIYLSQIITIKEYVEVPQAGLFGNGEVIL